MSRQQPTAWAAGIVVTAIAAGLALAGCAGGRAPAAAASGSGGSDGDRRPMDQNRLERIFSDQVEAITGPSGAIQSQIDGIPIYCISDPANDRMRIIAPIARVSGLDPRLPEILLRANFHSTLDARYAISDDAVFALYLHPLSSLTPRQIESAVAQVISLVKTFGSTFSSGPLVFPGPSDAGEPPPSESDSTSPPL